MINRRWIHFSLILLLGLPMFPFTAAGAGKPSFALSLNQSTMETGEEVLVTVKGEQLEDLFGYEIRLTYDPGRIRFKSASALWPGFSVPDSDDDGEVIFAHTKLGKSQGEKGAADIASFSFEAKGAGDAAITLTRIKLVDSQVQSVVETPQARAVLHITSAQTRSFSDLDGHWAKSAVEEAAGIGFINGYPDNTFRPDARINRAEFAAMLARAVPLSAEGETMLSYADADQIPEWAAPHIAAATASGILIGYSDRTFRWNSSITRAEMTVMIARTAHLELSEDTPAGFADDSEIPAWAYREVSTAKASGLIQGKNNNLFDSSCSATRAEAVTIILNLLHKSEG